MKRILLILFCAVMASYVSLAQVADSTVFRNPVKASDFKLTQLIVPGSLMATGALVHFAFHKPIDEAWNKQTSAWALDGQKQVADDYLRFLPEVMHIGYEYIGAEPQHGLTDRTIEFLWSFAAIGALGYGTRAIVNSPRPDGSNSHSFPSGHACISFAGAELVRMEYGWGCGAGAYAVATGVCVLRLYNNEHWLSDLMFGAGVGILSAHIGGWLLKPTKKIMGIDQENVSFATTVDPVSGAFCPTLALRF